jgi:hypothetical protein
MLLDKLALPCSKTLGRYTVLVKGGRFRRWEWDGDAIASFAKCLITSTRKISGSIN